MPNFGDTSLAELAFIAETTWGTTPTSPAFQKTRFTGEGLTYEIQNEQSQEITPNPSVADLIQVGAQASGDIGWELSYGSDFNAIFEAALRGTFTTGTVTQAVTVDAGGEILGATSITVDTDGSGDVAIVAGDVVYFGTNGPYYATASATIGSSSSGEITIYPGLRTALTGSEVVTVRNACAAGSAKDSFTFEKKFTTDSVNYMRYTGCRIDTFDFTVTPGSITGGTFSVLGSTETTGTSILSGATYTDANSNPIMAAPDVANLYIGGTTTQLYLQEIGFNLTNNLRAQTSLGNLGADGIGYGRREISGVFNAYFEDLELHNLFINSTESEISWEMTDGTNTYTFWVPRLKIATQEINAPGVNQDIVQEGTYQALYQSTIGSDFIICK